MFGRDKPRVDRYTDLGNGTDRPDFSGRGRAYDREDRRGYPSGIHDHRAARDSDTRVREYRTRDRSPSRTDGYARRASIEARFSANLSCKEINKRITHLPYDLASINEIRRLCEQNHGVLDAVNVATAVHRIATIIKKHNRYEILDSRLQSLLIDLALIKAAEFNEQGIANTLWAFATLNIRNAYLFAGLAEQARNIDKRFNTQHIANIVWAFATLGIRDDRLFTCLAERATAKASEFNPQEITNTLWAFATLGIKNDRLFASLAGQAMAMRAKFNPQGIANTLWAFASLGIKDDRLLACLAEQAMAMQEEFNPQNIANFLWAFATLSIRNGGLFAHLMERAKAKAAEFNSQNIANILWAFVTLGLKNEVLLGRLARQAMAKAAEFKPQEIANTLWAFATFSIKDERLFACLAERAMARAAEFKPQEIANTLWAFATLYIKDERLLACLAEQAMGKAAEFNPSDISNSLWACMCLEQNLLLASLLNRLPLNISEFNTKGLNGLYYVKLYCQHVLKNPEFVDRLNMVPSPKTDLRSSLLQDDVVNNLKGLWPSLAGQIEIEYEINGLTVDIAIPAKYIVIEVDGRSHFVMDQTGALSYDGSSRLKSRLLEAMGFRVVRIRYNEWDLKSFKEKQTYLEDVLKKVAYVVETSMPFSAAQVRGAQPTNNVVASNG